MVMELMQEDRPKIVITGPMSRGGQTNRGYLDISHLNSNMVQSGELSDAISRISPVNIYIKDDQLEEGVYNLAATGQIVSQRPPLSSLQIPSIDDVSMSSSESLQEVHTNCSRSSSYHGSRSSSYHGSRSNNGNYLANSHSNTHAEQNNNQITNDRRNHNTIQIDIEHDHLNRSNEIIHATRSRSRSPSANRQSRSPRNSDSYIESSSGLATMNNYRLDNEQQGKQHIKESRSSRPKPALRRQNATDEVEMTAVDRDNNCRVAFSREFSL